MSTSPAKCAVKKSGCTFALSLLKRAEQYGRSAPCNNARARMSLSVCGAVILNRVFFFGAAHRAVNGGRLICRPLLDVVQNSADSLANSSAATRRNK